MNKRLYSRAPALLAGTWVALAAAESQAPSTAPVHTQDEPVVVTATPLRESALQTTQPTSVLKGDELLRARAQSLGETLAAVPGLSATYFGPQASRPVIRGIGGERVQMYQDGGEALDASALSSDHSVTIDPLLARRIEVIRGPATLLYGNGAAGGLINVITDRIPDRPADRPLAGALETRGSSALTERSGAVHLDGGRDTWAWHADAHMRETGDVRIPGFALSRPLRAALAEEGEPITAMRRRLDNTASDTYGGALGTAWIGRAAKAGVAISRFDTEYGIPDSTGEVGARIDLRQTRYDFSSTLTGVGTAFPSARARVSYGDYRHAEVEASGAVGTLFEQTGVDARLSFDHAPLGGWRGTFGTQVRDIDLAVIGAEALLPASVTRHVGYFIYEERAFGAVTLDFGARFEHQKIDVDLAGVQDYDRSSLSSSMGGLWTVSPDYVLALHLTSTQRHPTATELYADGPHLAARRFEVGDPTLGRERALSTDLSLRRTAGRWRGSVTVFHTDYSRFIFAALTDEVAAGEEPGEELPVATYRQADARFTGVETELELPLHETLWGTLGARLVADYVRARLIDGGGDLPQIPPLRLGLELTLTRAAFTSALSAMYYDKQDHIGPNELPTEGYILVDIDMSYQLRSGARRLLLFMRGSNLLDKEARRHSSPLKDLAPLPGRSIGAGVRWEF